MRLFLILLFAFILTQNGWGQQVIIKEDFEFYWPLEQYDIQGDWSLEYPTYSTGSSMSVGAVVGRSRALKGPFTINISDVQLYDSIKVEAVYFGSSATINYWNTNNNYGLQISTDSLTWETPTTISTAYGYVWNYVINTQTYLYIRLYTPYEWYLDNLLVVGYTDNVSTNYCQFDTNGDGNIGAPDLLAFLEVYGTFLDCE